MERIGRRLARGVERAERLELDAGAVTSNEPAPAPRDEPSGRSSPLVFVGFGGGLTWGASVVKWDVSPPPVSFVDHEWRRVRYVMARGRSRLRRLSRRVEAAIAKSTALIAEAKAQLAAPKVAPEELTEEEEEEARRNRAWDLQYQ